MMIKAMYTGGGHSRLQCADVCVRGMKTNPFRKTSLVRKLTHIEENPSPHQYPYKGVSYESRSSFTKVIHNLLPFVHLVKLYIDCSSFPSLL